MSNKVTNLDIIKQWRQLRDSILQNNETSDPLALLLETGDLLVRALKNEQRDAVRYRYLRDRSLFDRISVRQRIVDSNGDLCGFQILNNDSLDREVDECNGEVPE